MSVTSDTAELVKLLDYVEQLFEELVPLTRPAEVYFQQAWSEVKPFLGRLRTRIQAIKDVVSEDWHKLQEHGLTGKQLTLKMYLLRQAISQGLPRVWSILNTILGSLADALGGGPIKELKELFEHSLGDEPHTVVTRLQS